MFVGAPMAWPDSLLTTGKSNLMSSNGGRSPAWAILEIRVRDGTGGKPS